MSIYIYIEREFGSSLSFKHVWLDNKDTFCSYDLIKNPFKFPNQCLDFWFELVNEFTKFVPSALGSFVDHHQGYLYV